MLPILLHNKRPYRLINIIKNHNLTNQVRAKNSRVLKNIINSRQTSYGHSNELVLTPSDSI